jgi:hypothetical protein
LAKKTNYEAQVKTERNTQRQEFIQTYVRFCGPIPPDELRDLSRSQEFF